MKPARWSRLSMATSTRDFAPGAAPPLSPRMAPPQSTHHPSQSNHAAGICYPGSHGNADLAQHPAGSDPRYVYLFGQTYGGNAALVRRRQIDRSEPFSQGQVGGMKQCARRQRGLRVALATFPGVARSDRIAMTVSALGAAKCLRPALSGKCLSTGGLAPKSLLQSIRFISAVFMPQLLMSLISIGSGR
jgi:hypothetical protein